MAHDPKQRLAEAELDELFAEARLHAPLPAADLMRRIEADALRLQPPRWSPRLSNAPQRRRVALVPGSPGSLAVSPCLLGCWLRG